VKTETKGRPGGRKQEMIFRIGEEMKDIEEIQQSEEV
jgi:hypothetical protein